MSTFPPNAGELAIVSFTAFCTESGVLRDGVIYYTIPRKKFPEAVQIGWLPVAPCGVRHGITVDLFAWMCGCKMAVPL